MGIQIPVYDSNKVRATGVPNVAQVQVPNGVPALSEGIMHVAKVLSDEQAKADQLRVLDAHTKLAEFDMQNKLDFENLQGDEALKPDENGFNPIQRKLDARDKYVQDLTATLGNQRQQELFKLKAAGSGTQFEESLQQHQLKQKRVFDGTVAQHSVEAVVSTARVNPGAEDTINAQLEDAKSALGIAFRGLDVEGRIKDLTSAVRGGQVEGYINVRDAKKARELFDQYRKDHIITDKDSLAIETKLRHLETTETVNAVLEENVSPYLTDDNRRNGIPAAEIIQNLRQDARLSNDPELLKVAVAAAENLIHTKRADWREQSDALMARVNNIRTTKGVWAAYRSTEMGELNAADPNKAEELMTHYESLMRTAERERAEKPSQGNWNEYFRAAEDPALPTWSDGKLDSMEPKLGTQLTIELKKLAHRLRTEPAAHKQMQVDHDQIRTELLSRGMISPKETAEDKVLVGQVAYDLKLLQEASGQPWSLEGTKKGIENLTRKVQVPGALWGTNEVPLIQVMHDQNVRIPQSFARAINAKALGEWTAAGNDPEKFPGIDAVVLYNAYFRAKKAGLIDDDGNYKPKTSLEVGAPVRTGHKLEER